MHQTFIPLSEDSYIEITTRLSNGEEVIIFAIRGTQDDAPALVSIELDDVQAFQIAASLQAVAELQNNKE